MIKVKWLVVMAILASAFLVACEEQVPAPYSSTVDITLDTWDWKIGCNNANCTPGWQGYLPHYLTAVISFPNKFAPTDPDVDQAVNNTEIRWYAPNGDLWLVDDDFKPYYDNECFLCSSGDCPENPKCKDVLWPLENPYDTKTEDDGTSEIVWVLPFYEGAIWANVCGRQLPFTLIADIGTDSDAFDVTITIDSCEQQQGQ